MNYKLGKKPARKGAVSFLFSDYFDPEKLPTPPPVFGHYQDVQNFHMLANDMFGCCVWAGAAHEQMIWSLEGGRPRARFTIHDVLTDYAAVTGFDITKTDAKGNNPTDQGSDMQQAAAYRKATGVLSADGSRHKIDGYLALKVGDWDQLITATYLFGAVGVGIRLPKTAFSQFDNQQPWTVPQQLDMAGGHYVPAVGRDANGNLIFVTWGRTHPATREFYERFSDEAVAYISLEIINAKNLSPEGYDPDELRKHLGILTA